VDNVWAVVQSTPKRSSGRFWLAGEHQRTVGGWLEWSGRWPSLELAEPLTSGLREVSRTEQADGSVLRTLEPADDDVQPDVVTVHGILRDGPRRVTLIDASSAVRQQILAGTVQDPGMQELRADYGLLGGHVLGRECRYRFARVRLLHLDVWAQLPGISTEVAEDGSRPSSPTNGPKQKWRS
jgi:hypothetical protein